MKYFCDKYGKECPHGSDEAQIYFCDAWDPRDFMVDKICRHALTVDNMELAKKQWLAANKIGPRNKTRIETPERKPVIINKDGEIDAKQTAILQRTELMRRQTEALEKLAAEEARITDRWVKVFEEVGELLAKQMEQIKDKLEPVARAFRDDDGEGDDVH